MKLKKLFTILFSASLLASCSNFMDCNESDYYSLEEIRGSYDRVKQFVTNIYGYLPSNFCNIGGAMHDAATDDAIHVYESSEIQRFVNGTWSANNTADDKYSTYYNGIHDANFYLENMTGLDFKTWEYGDKYEEWMKNYSYWEYEIRFLRAYFYFELVRRYQNVPLITKTLTLDKVNTVEPATAEEILDFIISECAEIAPNLPVDYANVPGGEKGHATRAAALALKARAALYAASPLYDTSNGNNKGKWIAAAKAAYEIIGKNTELGVGLDNSFSNLFGAQNHLSKEVILVRATGTSSSFESANFPMGVQNGKTTTCPTENLASAFEMSDGTPFDWNNATMRANPYEKRDPRFYLTIVHNGMNWPSATPVEIWEGGTNGLPLTNATTTGYYLRKYVDNSISFEAGASSAGTNHNWVLFRYAEVLLNYAEAMANAHDNIEYTDTGCGMSALDAINAVRGRTGVNMKALPKTISTTEFLKRVKNERRVELAFEGHRFWDLRRWKKLDQSKHIYAVKITKSGTQTNYTKTMLATHIIEDKLYFYPIANTELFKNTNLKQNQGWN